jgi:CRP-like cAMP-binding protein
LENEAKEVINHGMSSGTEERLYQAGDLIFSESSRPDGVYIVKEGMVEIFRTADSSQGPVEVTLDKVGVRGIFGEMGLIDHQPRSASARAMCLTRAVFISRQSFEKHLSTLPPWVSMLIKTFVHRLRETNRRLTQVLARHPEDAHQPGENEVVLSSGSPHDTSSVPGPQVLKQLGH